MNIRGNCVACWLRALVLGVAALLCAAAGAEPGSELQAGLEQQVRDLAQAATLARPAGVTRIDISVGQLDRRLRLAPCERVEPYLVTGVRLWGKSRIGLRCASGPSPWNVYLPITVKVYAQALVAAQPLPANRVLAQTDLIQAEVDLAEEASGAIADAGSVAGRVLAQAILPGQSLRQAHLKPRQWFAMGDTVRVLAVGTGFSVAAEGEALTPGVEGRPARVRTEGGRVLTGLPVGERRMEMSL